MKHLYEELRRYAESDYYPFHMPGHKRQTIVPEETVEKAALAFHKRQMDIYKLDISEIEGFDDLHHAEGLLKELQEKAAGIYHAEESFFLINGSTGGILSAVSAAAQEGKKLLMARNCHKSVYHAVLLNRLKAEYLWPEIIEEFEIQGEITVEQVERKLKNRDDICGVVITSPTYDGIVSDIRKIAETVHKYQIPLIVDEAHGAHFVLSEKAPESAVECGADVVINSVHKTLPAMTQTALLHVQGNYINRENLKKYLQIYQSSSPSYILMASIDSCMDFILKQGHEGYERLLRLREKIEEAAKRFSHIRIFPVREHCDPGKLIISVKGTDMTGQELYRRLLETYHLQMEMASRISVLGILTVSDTEEGVERLLRALKEIDAGLSAKKDSMEDAEVLPLPVPAPCLSIYEADRQEKEWIPLRKAAGKISGGFIYPYPPGIPLIVPGEMIGEELLQRVEAMKREGLNLVGLSEKDGICVLKDNCKNL